MQYVVIGLAAAVSGYAIYRNWRKIVRLFRGKKVAVLGKRGVGKSRLIEYLTNGTVHATEKYKQTLAPVEAKGRKFDIRDLQLKLRETLEVPGSTDAYKVWKDLFDDSDLVFYLFRVDQIRKNDAEAVQRIVEDTKQIRQWIDEKKRDCPTVIIIGTFCDQDPEYMEQTPSTIGNYQDRFMKTDVIKTAVRYLNAEWWILGSMLNLESTEDLAYRVFDAAKSLRK